MKAKARRTRETRAAYRVRTSKSSVVKARAAGKRGRKVLAPVPWEQRIAPTDEQLMEWHLWLNQHSDELEEKYPGRYLAIWDKQVIAATVQRDEIYPLAHGARPEVIPLITYIPRVDEVNLVPSVFPVEWRKADAE